MRRSHTLLLTIGCCVVSTQCIVAQSPRQAARQERRDARQDVRAANRGAYFSDQTWSQLNPWVTRNNVQPATRVGAAANAAANTAERALDATANAASRAVDATQKAANTR